MMTYKQLLTTALAILFSFTLYAQEVKIGNKKYPSIQAAINKAYDGETIKISGVHNESLKVNKRITLQGTDPNEDKILGVDGSVISANGKYGAESLVVENLTIANGKSMGSPGGGIQLKRVKGESILRNLIITNNATDRVGGGIMIAASKVTIERCWIDRNYAVNFGGGIAVNSGNAGETDVTIKNSVISTNTCDKNGGGLYLNGNKKWGDESYVNLNVENTILTYNTAKVKGGGVFVKGTPHLQDEVTNTSLMMNHVTVAYNRSLAEKGRNPGISFYSQKGAEPKFSITNSLVVNNGEGKEPDVSFGKSDVVLNVGNIYSKVMGVKAMGVDMSKSSVIRNSNQIALSDKLTMAKGELPQLKIKESSVAINAAHDDYALALDLNDNKRSEADIGAVEFE